MTEPGDAETVLDILKRTAAELKSLGLAWEISPLDLHPHGMPVALLVGSPGRSIAAASVAWTEGGSLAHTVNFADQFEQRVAAWIEDDAIRRSPDWPETLVIEAVRDALAAVPSMQREQRQVPGALRSRSPLLDVLVELLESIDTSMVAKNATVEQPQALQSLAAKLSAWASVGLLTHGAPPAPPTDSPPPRH